LYSSIFPSVSGIITSTTEGFFFIMLTVYEVFNQWCQDHEMAPPSNNDLREAGALIGHHFRKYWGISHPEEVRNAGFKLSSREGCLVLAYPELFLLEMYRMIEYFLKLKKERMDKANEKPVDPTPSKPTSEPKKKDRKRIPLNKPAFSGNKFK